MAGFSVDRFVEQCLRAKGDEKAALELVREAMADPGAVSAGLREPAHAGFEVLHRSPALTVLNFAWAPWMCFKPHNHSMWSVVGIFAGREDNLFWRRTEASIEAAGARSLGAGDTALLGRDVIHSVVNPIARRTRALHVYGGDFFAPEAPRSEWDPETLHERPWDLEHAKRLFAEAEARGGRG